MRCISNSARCASQGCGSGSHVRKRIWGVVLNLISSVPPHQCGRTRHRTGQTQQWFLTCYPRPAVRTAPAACQKPNNCLKFMATFRGWPGICRLPGCTVGCQVPAPCCSQLAALVQASETLSNIRDVCYMLPGVRIGPRATVYPKFPVTDVHVPASCCTNALTS